MQIQKNRHKPKPFLFLGKLVLTFLFIVPFIIIPNAVSAHPPSDMTVSYNLTTQELRVTITHQVSNPTTHYILKVEIKKNGVIYNTSIYTSQPDPTSFTYSYKINTTTGDNLDVTASCKQGGSKTIQYTVGTNNGESKKSTPGFELIIVMGAIALMFLWERKVKKQH